MSQFFVSFDVSRESRLPYVKVFIKYAGACEAEAARSDLKGGNSLFYSIPAANFIASSPFGLGSLGNSRGNLLEQDTQHSEQQTNCEQESYA